MEYLDFPSFPAPQSQFYQAQIPMLPSYHVTILEVSTVTSVIGLGPVPFVFPLHFVRTAIFSTYCMVLVC